jgi:hypothetical protein
MRLWYLVLVLLSLALVPPVPAAAQSPDAKSDLGANAALKYWQAFAVLPRLDKDQEKLLEEGNRSPLDAAALKLIDSSEKSRMYLHRGAKLPRCDWSLDYEDGVNLLLPHLTKARTLARLTLLHARYAFEQGHSQEGVEDVTAVLVLARQLDPDPSLISALVRTSIEAMAIETLAPYLPRLDAASFKALSYRLDNLPVGETIEKKLLAENKYVLGSKIKMLQEADKKKEGSWRDALKVIFGVEAGGETPEAIKSIPTLEKAVKLLEDLDPVYTQQAKLAALPREEFDAQYPEFMKKAKTANPLAAACLPDVARFLAVERRNQTQILLLKAAIAVVQGGPEKVKDFKDPFGTGQFEYKALDKGFELKSKLIYRDQPVTLVVGAAKK